MTRKSRYELALAKVSEAEGQIGEMEQAIEEKEPLSRSKAQQVEEFAKTVEENAKEVGEVRKYYVSQRSRKYLNHVFFCHSFLQKEGEVLIEEEKVQEIGRKADALSDLWKEEVEPAYPPLNDAISLLKSLNPPDILALKGMKNPPAPVKLVLEAVCILMVSRRGPLRILARICFKDLVQGSSRIWLKDLRGSVIGILEKTRT
jgi:dynein heavy chain